MPFYVFFFFFFNPWIEGQNEEPPPLPPPPTPKNKKKKETLVMENVSKEVESALAKFDGAKRETRKHDRESRLDFISLVFDGK